MRDYIVNNRRLKREAPQFTELELDHRTHPYSPWSDLSNTVIALIFILGGVLFTVGLVFTLGALCLTAAGLLVGLNIGIALGCLILMVTIGQSWRLAGIVTLVCPLITLSLGLMYAAIQNTVLLGLLACLAALGMALLTASITTHFQHLMLAHPRLPRNVRTLRAPWYSCGLSSYTMGDILRHLESEPPAPDDPAGAERKALRVAELRLVKSYPLGVVMIAGLYLAIALLMYRLPLSVLALILPPACAAIISLRQDPRVTSGMTLQVIWRALTSWLSYGRAGTDMPGVFQSPGGSLPVRAGILATVLLAFSLTLLPLVHYFPFGYDLNLPNAHAWDMAAPDTEGHLAPIRDAVGVQRNVWIGVAIQAIAHGQWEHYPLLLAAGLACGLFPLIALLSSLMAGPGVALALAYLALEAENAPEQLGTQTSDWECRIGRLMQSEMHLTAGANPPEYEHLWLGTHVLDDFPILLHRKILAEHAYIAGTTGSGKTALAITPLVTQLIRHKGRTLDRENGQFLSEPGGIVIIDIKGDNALFQTARLEAEAAGLEFKYFTNELHKATYTFNPIRDTNVDSVSINQFCETILEALNLNHGDGYGKGFYSRVARRWLSRTLSAHPDLRSFDELRTLTTKGENFEDPKERGDALEMIAAIESIANFEALNTVVTAPHIPETVLEHSIHMPEVIAKRQVVYFWLPAAKEAASVREIAKLALYALLVSALRHMQAYSEGELPVACPGDREKPQTYLVIDEFQRIASTNFKIILEQARSMGIGAILANQSLQDLRTPETDLRSTIETNTRFRVNFSATDPEQQDVLTKAGGTVLNIEDKLLMDVGRKADLVAFNPFRPFDLFLSFRENNHRLRRNTLIQASDDPYWAISHIPRGSGYTQYSGFPFLLETGYSITGKEHARREQMPWPIQTERTLVVKRPVRDIESISIEERYRKAGIIQDEIPSAEEPAQEENAPRTEAAPTPEGEILAPIQDRLRQVMESMGENPGTRPKRREGRGRRAPNDGAE